jgi:hypothetical protein
MKEGTGAGNIRLREKGKSSWERTAGKGKIVSVNSI